jgi:hypothetical protein
MQVRGQQREAVCRGRRSVFLGGKCWWTQTMQEASSPRFVGFHLGSRLGPLENITALPALAASIPALAMRFIILIAAGLVSLAVAARSVYAPRETDVEATDRLVFQSTITEFTRARAARTPVTLDWVSDGCSRSPDEPLDFNCNPLVSGCPANLTTPVFAVLPSCYRHDFAYRNYKRQLRFNETSRKRIDSNFKNDMYQECESQWSEHVCRMAANIYFKAVRVFGNTGAAQQDKGTQAALKALQALREREAEASIEAWET